MLMVSREFIIDIILLSTLWGHPHNSTSPSSLRNAPTDRLRPLRRASETALFWCASKRYLLN